MPEKTVIPLSAVPPQGTHELEVDGRRVLLRNEVMYTPYQHSAGEHSAFLLALRDEKKILGARCPRCGQVICPPFMRRCPECDFVEMDTITLPDRGVMVASPSITYFGNARFKTRVPFALGYVYLGEADTALLMICYTTRGLLRSGVFRKGTPVKVVFADERTGAMSDVFVVPEAELSPEQLNKPGLLESELTFTAAPKPELRVSETARPAFEAARAAVGELLARVPRSPRARAALADWTLTLSIETGGGAFGLRLAAGKLEETDLPAQPDLQLIIQDPAHLEAWVRGRSLTNMVADGQVWIDKSEGLNWIFLLDRLPRAVRRDLGEF